MLTSTLILAVLGLASATPVGRRSPYVVKETHAVPSYWTKVSPAPENHRIKLQIGLKQSQFDELERHLYEVSDPFHDRYGQHLTHAEVSELIKPAEDTLELVHEWLFDHGIEKAELSYTPAKDWITVTLPVASVEKLLDAEYSVFQHTDGEYIVRSPSWSLPENLHAHIDTIQPTNSFFRPRQQASTAMLVPDSTVNIDAAAASPSGTGIAAVCDFSNVTPDCLRTLYGTIDYKPRVPGINQIGINNFLGEIDNRSDIHIFLQDYRPEAAAAAYTFKFESIANGTTQQTPETPAQLAAGTGLEGNLDAETVLSATWPTPMTAYTTGGSPPFKPDDGNPTDTNEPYLVWLNHVTSQFFLPQVISTSYADDEQTVPYSYAKRVCDGFAQLGARGVSALLGSGDSGVGATPDCFSNNGTNAPTFLAMFPTSCPYITSVGATRNYPEIVAYDTENGFVSGGGFSNYFPRPFYQDWVVPPYVKSLGSEYQGLYNPNGRGYPDVAAQGYHYTIVWDGQKVGLDGTSCATPTFSSVVSLVNDALLSNGRPPLGFLNPWLYAFGYQALTDVTVGSTTGCGTAGFPAAVGWDAASGFGTPNFHQILQKLFVF